MSSPVRKLAPRLAAVVLRLLLFIGCAGAAQQLETSVAIDANTGTCDGASRLEPLRDHNLRTHDLRAIEPESVETDAPPAPIKIRLAVRTARLGHPLADRPRSLGASRWPPQPILSVAMAQGPPRSRV